MSASPIAESLSSASPAVSIPQTGRLLTWSERWMRDGMRVCTQPAFAVSMDVEMTRARTRIEAAKTRGSRLTYTHLFVQAAAQALAQNPDLHKTVCGNRVNYPDRIDIALSVSGDTAVAPLMVIRDAAKKHLRDIASEIADRAPETREKDRAMARALDTWGFLVPFGFLRRALLRLLFMSRRFRSEGSGTFQVSVLPGVDQASTSAFSTSAMLVAGAVRDRAVAVNGKPEVRPMVTLTCCADHRAWDGVAARRFLHALRMILESADA